MEGVSSFRKLAFGEQQIARRLRTHRQETELEDGRDEGDAQEERPTGLGSEDYSETQDLGEEKTDCHAQLTYGSCGREIEKMRMRLESDKNKREKNEEERTDKK